MAVPQSSRSTLHLQLGQETLYLILAIAVFAAVMMAAVVQKNQEIEKDPPIITMKEANGFYFPTASAEISPEFRQKLITEIVPLVAQIGTRAHAEVVEVIGHTDEVPISARYHSKANLDQTLMGEFVGDAHDNKPIQAADNVGLGMARAVAVANVLRSSRKLAGFQIFPMSAGAFQRTNDTMTDGELHTADQERRRIVIRVRRNVDQELQAGAK
jgi:flagellar motor protein MotB